MDRTWFAEKIIILVPMILSLTVHEWAHAYTAYRLGDDTAARMGRLTLNPLVHMDPLGTLLLPLLGIPFGWAKPVPVNPARFRRDVPMRTGMMITAAAGPASNLLIAIACAVGFGLALRFGVVSRHGGAVNALLDRAITLNVLLALFNLLPIPPLDGSRVVDGLLPYRFRAQWETIERYSMFGLLIAFAAGSYVLAGPIDLVESAIYQVVRVIAG